MAGLEWCPWCMAELDGGTLCPSCGRDPSAYAAGPMHLRPGTTLQSRYVLGRAIREDGGSLTYIAIDEVLRKRVDVRERRMPAGNDADAGQGGGDTVAHEETLVRDGDALLDQARRVARLSGRDALPVVVDLFEESGSVFVVYDHVEGMTLWEYVQSRGDDLSFDDLRGVLYPVCRTLISLNDAGISLGPMAPKDIIVGLMGTYLVKWPMYASLATPAGAVITSSCEHDYAEGRQGPVVAAGAEGADESKTVAPLDRDARYYEGLSGEDQTKALPGLHDAVPAYGGDAAALCACIYQALTGRDARDEPRDAFGVEIPDEALSALMRGLDAHDAADGFEVRAFYEAWYGSMDFEAKTVAPVETVVTRAPASVTVRREDVSRDAAESTVEGTGLVSHQHKRSPSRIVGVVAAVVAVAAMVVAVLVIGRLQTQGTDVDESMLSIGLDNTALVRSDGTVWVLGTDEYGQHDAETWTDVAAVSVGGFHVLGLKSDGTVLACGRNDEGQGNISGATQATSVSAGWYHSAVLLEDGSVRAAGKDNFGQCEVDSWRDVTRVVCGSFHTVAVKADGSVVATGSNEAGQCEVDSWSDVTQVAAGHQYTIGLRKDGTCVATGENSSGQCDVEDWDDIVSIGAGYSHTVGLRSDGTVLVTGSNDYGQLDIDEWPECVKVYAGGLCTIGLTREGVYVTCGYRTGHQLDVDGLGVNGLTREEIEAMGLVMPEDSAIAAKVVCGRTYTARIADGKVEFLGKIPTDFDTSKWDDVISLAYGDAHLAALHADGTVSATGANEHGQCDVSEFSDITSLFATPNRTVGLRSDGTVVATGMDEEGQNEVSSWSDIQMLALSDEHSVGLRSDGTVVAAGMNDDGQCDVSEWSEIVSIRCGEKHTVALRSDGTVLATGADDEGQCEVSSWSDVTSISAGRCHTLGLRSDGTVVATGANEYGQCDVSGWSDVVVVESLPTIDVTYGLGKGGTSLACGDNRLGQCDIAGNDDLAAQYFGERHILGLSRNGRYVAEGDNVYGQCDVGAWNEKTGKSTGTASMS